MKTGRPSWDSHRLTKIKTQSTIPRRRVILSRYAPPSPVGGASCPAMHHHPLQAGHLAPLCTTIPRRRGILPRYAPPHPVGGASCPALRRHIIQRKNREPPSKPKKPSITKRTICNIWYILLFNDYHIQTETHPLNSRSCTNHFRFPPMAGKRRSHQVDMYYDNA